MPDHRFRNTTVWVRDPEPGVWDPNANAVALATPPGAVPRPAQVGPCVPYLLQHLEDLWNLPFGQAFFTALGNYATKKQVVQFIGTGVANDNSCKGGGNAIMKVAKSAFENDNWTAARAELQNALNAELAANVAHNMNWFGTQILTTQLHRWDPATTAPNSPLNPAAVLPANPLFNL